MSLLLALQGTARKPVFTSYSRRWLFAALLSQVPQPIPGAQAAPLPFAQGDWPNPRAAARPIELHTWLVQGLCRDVGAPLVSPQFQLPRVVAGRPELRTWTQSPQIQPPASAAPFAQTDWPAPPREQAGQQSGQAPNLLLTTLGDQPIVVFRTPLLAGLAPRDLGAALGSQGQSLALLSAPVATDPLTAAKDWPNPRTPAAALELRSWLVPGLCRQVGAPLLPPWCELPRVAALRPELRTWTQSPQIQPVASAAPFAQTEWPRPAPRGTQDSSGVQGGVILPPDPDVRAELTLPQVAKRRHDLLTWTGNLLESTLGLQAPDPTRPSEWPLPGRAPHPLGLRTWSVNLLQSTLEPGAPRLPLEWPLPGRAQHPLELRTLAVNLLESTLAPAPVVPLDWPNPGRAPFPISARTLAVNLLQTGLVGDPRLPFDWPLPGRAPHPISARTLAVNLLQTTLEPGAPRRPIIVDNPRGYAFALELRTHIALPLPGNIPTVPDPVYGWGARSKIGSRGAADVLKRVGTEQANDAAKQLGSQTAVDANKAIGSETAADGNQGIGSASAADPNQKIGSDQA